MSNPTISLTTFIPFVLTSGMPRVSRVRDAIAMYNAVYDPARDWYKRLRAQILRINEEQLPLSTFATLLEQIPEVKQETYLECVSGYRQFHGVRRPIVWLGKPVPAHVNINGLSIRVNPELFVEKNGQKYLVKVYFKDEPLNKKHAELIIRLMERAYPTMLENNVLCAVLDLRRGKLHDCFPSKHADKLLDAEAAAFVHLWNQLVA